MIELTASPLQAVKQEVDFHGRHSSGRTTGCAIRDLFAIPHKKSGTFLDVHGRPIASILMDNELTRSGYSAPERGSPHASLQAPEGV